MVQYRSNFLPKWVQFLWMSWQKFVFVVLLWPSIGTQKQILSISTQIFELHLRGFLLVVVVLLAAQVRDQLVQAMRNSDPRVRIVLVYSFNTVQVINMAQFVNFAF